MQGRPPYPADEEERLAALRRYRILDTDPEPQFDRIANIAKRQFNVPIALVAFMDAQRNFLKARCDLPMSEAPRDISFCAYTILDDEVLVVLDATRDPRFSENPVVAGDFHIRFYAGAPLITPAGHRIGTVCVFDTEPRREFGAEDRQALRDLASIISDHLEMRLIVGNVHDEIETRRAAEREAQRLVFEDPLTGLPNFAQLQKIIDRGLPFSPQGLVAAFAADLDDFKAVNAALGHHAGDELLRRTARIIRSSVDSRAFVARISGDEFVVLLDGPGQEAVKSVAETIAARTAEPFLLAGHTVSNGVSIGIAFVAPGEADIGTLLRNADMALRAAKRLGGAGVAVFDETMAIESLRASSLVRDLAFAIPREEIEVHYQPIHQAPRGRMIGVEALARWTHPEMGPISPVEFIALAEESGQILELGESILRSALKAARLWGDLFISVNLSPVQFKVADLTSTVASLLRDSGCPPQRLQLEVTENVLLKDIASARQQIDSLHTIGVELALDDFGTGYSSLNYLADLPIDNIKIDRSFVKGACDDSRRHAIIRHIVGLAHELDMRVTAEGVETEEEAVLVTAAGCTSLQGYLFGRPMPAAQIAPRLNLSSAAA